MTLTYNHVGATCEVKLTTQRYRASQTDVDRFFSSDKLRLLSRTINDTVTNHIFRSVFSSFLNAKTDIADGWGWVGWPFPTILLQLATKLDDRSPSY